jgi:heterodisulfide reductase subunit A2
MEHITPRIGVYTCHCGLNISPQVNVEQVSDFAGNLEHVIVARNYKFMCSNPGQSLVIQDIKEQNINRVVVASCSPRMHEQTFRKACETAGLNSNFFQMANIREQSAWVTENSKKATQKAKELVSAAVARVAKHQALFTREVSVKKSIAVIGAGIAGMQSALTAANAGFEVHLIEKESSIGGHMSKFDKTFPTLDCAACISTPKTVAISQHPNIQLHTYSELEQLEGFVGNYTLTINQKARYISNESCTGCGLCTEKCPVDLPNDFDEGLSTRKAIYRSFPQAIPSTFCIDKKDPAPCIQQCPAGCNVQGYVQLVKEKKYQQALNIIMDTIPLPGVLGRVCNHPCETDCRRKEVESPLSIRELKRFAADQGDLKQVPIPEIKDNGIKIAIIGSGPAGLTVAFDLRKKGYCVKIFEALPELGGMLRVGIPEYRLPSEVLDNEIDNILSLGIETQLNSRLGIDFQAEDLKQQGYRAIFLGTGAHQITQMGIPGESDIKGVLNAISFLRNVNLHQEQPLGQEVVIIGGGNVAVDVAGVAIRLGAKKVSIIYRRSEAEMPAFSEEIELVKNEGVHLSCLVAPMEIVSENNLVTGLKCQKTELGPVDDSGRRMPIIVENSEFIIPCDSVIPAIGQIPEKYSFESIEGIQWNRNHTIQVNRINNQTDSPYVFAGGDLTRGPATVVEAIADGHNAARAIDEFLNDNLQTNDSKLDLLNQSSKNDWQSIPKKSDIIPRSTVKHLEPTVRNQSFREISKGLTEEQARTESQKCLNCSGCCECFECLSVCEANAIDHLMPSEKKTLEVGAVILATGYKAFNPEKIVNYGYGFFPEVYTSLEFERLNNATGPTSGKILTKKGETPRRVAIVHCVGSRDANHLDYCSRVCCMYSMKFAHLVKERTGAEIWEFYIDIRSPGKLYEEFYNRVQEDGVHFVRGRVSEITDIVEDPADLGRLTVSAENTLTGKRVAIPVDMVVLGVGLEASEDVDKLGRMTGVSRDRNGWFNELHAKLAPVNTAVNGVFLAGCCQGPKDIPDTVAQSMAAAGEAIALLAKGTVQTMAEISHIDAEICVGCQSCIPVCPYSAIEYIEGQSITQVNEALCQGCGSCAATCPSSAANVRHFTDQQVLEEIEALL